jgi:hypothetical protein
MTTMIAEVYNALVAAGSPEDKARRAAEAIVAYESRFGKIEADLNLLKWMVGFVLAFCVAILSLQLRH